MSFDTYRHLIGIVALGIGLMQYVPMLYMTLIGRKQPHAFTRLVWGLCLGITFVAQWLGHGGIGSLSTGLSCLFCLAISAAAARNGKTYITRADWIFFIAALMVIPLWMITRDPLEAVVFAFVIDFLGYIPTFRKSWSKPHDELITAFGLGCLKQTLAATALATYSPVTLFFPVAAVALDIGFILTVIARRYAIRAVQVNPA